jgi:hypothetical protein
VVVGLYLIMLLSVSVFSSWSGIAAFHPAFSGALLALFLQEA